MREFILVFIFFVSLQSQAQVGTYKIVYEYDIIAKEKNPDLSLIPQILKGDKVTCFVGEQSMKVILSNENKTVSTIFYDVKQNVLYEKNSNKKFGMKQLGTKDGKVAIHKTGKYDMVVNKRCYVGEFGEEEKTEIKFSPEVQSKFDLPFYSFNNVDDYWLIISERQIILEKKFEFPTFYIVQRAKEISLEKFDGSLFELPEHEYFYTSESVDQPFELADPTSSFNCLFKKIKKPKELQTEVTVYIEFVLTKDGTLKYADYYNEVPFDLHKKSLKAFTSCQLSLKPAYFNGQAVSSVCYFPIKIRPEKE